MPLARILFFKINEMIGRRGRIILIFFCFCCVLIGSGGEITADQNITNPYIEGKIVVYKGKAMIEINGELYEIMRENSAYTQFEGRYIRFFAPHLIIKGNQKKIDFNRAMLIDAIV